MSLDKEKTRLALKLREVRSIMRENGIGHLYPDASIEHENEVKSATAVGGENYFALQRMAWHNANEAESWKKVAHDILAWLQVNHRDIVSEMPKGIFSAEISLEFDVKKFLESGNE